MHDLLRRTKDLTLLPQPWGIRDLEKRTNELSKTIAELNLCLVGLYYYIKRHGLDFEPENQETDDILEPSELIVALSSMKIDDIYDEDETSRHVAIAYARVRLQDLFTRLPAAREQALKLYEDVKALCLKSLISASSDHDPRLDHEEDGRKRRRVKLLYSSVEEFRWRIEDIEEGVKELPVLLV